MNLGCPILAGPQQAKLVGVEGWDTTIDRSGTAYFQSNKPLKFTSISRWKPQISPLRFNHRNAYAITTKAASRRIEPDGMA